MIKKHSTRALKIKVFDFLRQDDFKKGIKGICEFPAKQIIGPLFSHFYHGEDLIRWRAVTAMGIVVSGLAESGEMEAARVVMRRLMWNLNDESGGIGWGSPEAMGEIMARNAAIAQEFHQILTSYANEEGNFLEHEVLQRGLLWGLGRLAHARPGLIHYAAPYIVPFMKSHDPIHRGLAAWTALALDHPLTNPLIKSLTNDNAEIRVFMDGKMLECTVAFLSKGA